MPRVWSRTVGLSAGLVKMEASMRLDKGIWRHFEGWQPAALAVFLAGSVASVVVPRPVEPGELPEPSVDGRELARIAARDEALAAAAKREPLEIEVRAVG